LILPWLDVIRKPLISKDLIQEEWLFDDNIMEQAMNSLTYSEG